MKTLTCIMPGQMEYGLAEKPALRPGQAIIKITRVGICGTDLHAFEGTQPFFDYPRILGHELAGEIVAIEKNLAFELGEWVTIIPYFNCGACIACRSGKPNCCRNLKVCGVHQDGGMVEFLSVPTSSLVHGSGLTVDEMAMVEPLAIGAHAVGRAGVNTGENVLVVGAGPIGLGIMAFARMAGANVICLDIDKGRLNFCRTSMDVQFTINGIEDDVMERLKEITDGEMPTVVIDASGSLKAINNAFHYLAHGGRYLLVGLQKEEVCFSHPEFHKREATLMSSRNATRKDFEWVMACVKEKRLKPDTLISHRVTFDEAKAGFRNWVNPGAGVIKAMIELG